MIDDELHRVDDELHQAAANLRSELAQVTPPPFKPRSQLGGRVVLVAATVAVFAIGFALYQEGIGGDLESEIGPAETTPDVSTEVVPVPDVSTETVPEEADQATDRPSAGQPVSDAAHRPASMMDRPSLGEYGLEPEFETVLTAVTDAPTGATINPIPEGAPSWNADGSLLVLYESGTLEAGHVLYDGQTFARLGSLPFAPRDIEELHWDPQLANRLYYTEGNRLLAFEIDGDSAAGEVAAGTTSTINEFIGCSEVGTPLSPKPVSADGRLIGLLCLNGEGPQWIAFDLTNGQERRAAADNESAPQPSPSGSRFLSLSDEGLVRVLDVQLRQTGLSITTDTTPTQFIVVGTNDGRELLVTTIFDGPDDRIGSVIGFDIETGEVRNAVGLASGFPYPPAGTRVSAATANNGLVAVSIAGAGQPDEQDTLDGELLVVDFNPETPVAYRVGHHRSPDGGTAFDSYWSTARVAVDPSGTRLLFSSHWEQDRVDTFLIDISHLRP